VNAGWKVTSFAGANHVMPVEDLKEHFESRECWCVPTVEPDAYGTPTWVHHSKDRREFTVERQ
jgi:hypothetical protein